METLQRVEIFKGIPTTFTLQVNAHKKQITVASDATKHRVARWEMPQGGGNQ